VWRVCGSTARFSVKLSDGDKIIIIDTSLMIDLIQSSCSAKPFHHFGHVQPDRREEAIKLNAIILIDARLSIYSQFALVRVCV
jgi:hypothetical protein